MIETPVSSEQSHVVYEFGDFRLDPRRRLVFARGAVEPLPIAPKVFEAILYFVERPGELLEKDRLIADLWPGLVVEENSLTQLISTLRRVLGETRGENRYFATVPGRGYRFVADVARASESSPIGSPAPAVRPADLPGRARASRTARITVLAFACLFGATLIAFAGYALWVARESAQQSAEPSVASELPARTVAVLAFENLSSDPNFEYLALGIPENILHRLAGITELTVIAGTSSFAFRDKAVDARTIGRELGARYLVEGSVQVLGEKLRVTAQLIDATTGARVESLKFDRTIDDVLLVEDEIAHRVAQALEVRLAEGPHPYAQYGTDAYLQFMEGQTLIASRKVVDAERAIERFSRAIEIAPTFAAAYATLAEAHRHLAHLIDNACSSPAMQAVPAKALPLLTRALELDDSLGRAYVVRADLKNCSGDTAGAEADFRTGLELDPGYGAGHARYAEFLFDHGRTDEALGEIDKAISVDPVTPRHYYLKGLFLDTGGSAEESVALYLRALQIAPDFHPARMRLAAIRGYREGRFAEAVKLAEQAVALDPRAPWMLSRPVHFYLEVEDVDAARAFVAEQPEALRPALWLPICLYERQPERAAEILRANPQRWSDFMGQDVEVYVLRDAAMAGGQLARARAELPTLLKGAEDTYSAIARAQLSFALGDRREGERLARAVLDEADDGSHVRAIAYALRGESQAALEQLEQEFEHGGRRWWYVFDREPAFEELRRDARFRELAARVRTRAAEQRRLLEQMRERGEVPRRVASATAGAAPC